MNEENIKKRQATIFFNCKGEWETRVNFREAVGELDVGGIGGVLD